MDPIIAAAATQSLFKTALEFVIKNVKGPAQQAGISALAAIRGYGPHLEETHRRVSTFKSFADPSKPVPLLQHYVTTIFNEGSATDVSFDQDDLLERLLRPSRLVISATAGFGKSMVLRFLSLALYENPRGKIPLFIELRHINRVTSPNLLAFINSTYAQSSKVRLESLRQGMATGAFILLLDGFDELNHEIRGTIEAQMLDLAREFPAMSVVVSGRPDERFKSWRDFSIVKICPMSILQVVDLLNKLDYDLGVKKRFIRKVETGLYDSHESFLSTPLLAILMLLTFERNSNIPEKLHLFYAKAFETLFEKHDATKEQHERARKTDLAIDQFQSLFSTFCLNSYVREITEFEHAEILKLVRESIKYHSLDISPDDFLFDIEESVCLMMREGGSFFFVHRSFQEYFTAVFLSQCPEETRDEFLDSVAMRHWDSVLSMLFEMARAQLEPTWVKHNLETYLSQVGRTKGKMRPIFARFESIVVHERGDRTEFVTFSPGPFNRFVMTLRRFYPQMNVPFAFVSDAIEVYVRENWASIKNKTKKTRKLSGGEKYEIREAPLSEVPLAVLRKSGLLKLTDAEMNMAEQIYNDISKEQGEKGKFLQKLFAS